jgi:hypothetical protein
VYLTTQDYAMLVATREEVKKDSTIDLYTALFSPSTVVTAVLTTDLVFVAGKEYYTRTGAGGSDDPFVYTKRTVTPDTEVPANEYYELIAVHMDKENIRLRAKLAATEELLKQ